MSIRSTSGSTNKSIFSRYHLLLIIIFCLFHSLYIISQTYTIVLGDTINPIYDLVNKHDYWTDNDEEYIVCVIGVKIFSYY